MVAAQPVVVEVKKKKAADKMGLTLADGAEGRGPPIVSHVNAGEGLFASAVRRGQVTVGMALLSVNGEPAHSREQAVKAIAAIARGTVRLQFGDARLTAPAVSEADAARARRSHEGTSSGAQAHAQRSVPKAHRARPHDAAADVAASAGGVSNRGAASTAKRAAKGGATAGGGWRVRWTVDGCEYYHNVLTEAVCWEKPLELQSVEEQQSDTSECAWVRGTDGGWQATHVLKRTAHALKVKPVGGGKERELKLGKDETYPLRLSQLDERAQPEDLVMLEALHPPLVAHCLQHRFEREQVYTWVGADQTVLIAVNPFRTLHCYGAHALAEAVAPAPNRIRAPHTYAVAASAYQQVLRSRRGAAVLISGESGAGKTEATKQCLALLAEVAGSAAGQSAVAAGLEQRLLRANPILEAFGNAKTVRNDNSSRFGRWLEIHVAGSGVHEGAIVGASLETYLLEKSRVVTLQPGERSYHAFYQLCSSAWAPSLCLSSCEAYASLRPVKPTHTTTVPAVDSTAASASGSAAIGDAAEFEEMLDALTAIGLDQAEVQWLFYLTASLLHLSNVTFDAVDGGEGSIVSPSSAEALSLAALFLGVAPSALEAALVERQVVIRGEVQHMRNRVKEAREATEALAKAVYAALFAELVRRINTAIGGERGLTIGVLDIFGFEIFESNSFEQLCINYANEKLQAKFNEHTFVSEESIYLEEGITYEPVPFIDNTPVLDLLAAKPHGVLPLLSDEVRVPQGSDDKLLAKIVLRHRGQRHLFRAPGTPAVDGASSAVPLTAFEVVHYAGPVVYSVGGMVEKNADSLSRTVQALLAEQPSDPRTRALFPAPSATEGGRVRTVEEQFRAQLTALMTTLNAAQPLFIRCIKPNQSKAAGRFETATVLEQLTYAGVFEATAIRKSGFPFRREHTDFARHYRWIARGPRGWAPLPPPTAEPAELCRAILAAVPQDFSEVRIGATLVLYRSREHRVLELLNNLSLGRLIQQLQAAFRRRLGRTHRALLRAAVDPLQAALSRVEGGSLVGAAVVSAMEDALEAYHRQLGSHAVLFADIVPAEYTRASELCHVAREVALKEAYLDERGTALELRLFPLLHSPAVWAAGRTFGRAARADGMLRFSEHVIHRPLCQLEKLAPQFCERHKAKRVERELLAQYKNLHSWLGLRRTSYPDALASEWLRYGVESPIPLRIELYVHLLKQLTDVPPDSTAEERGWQLLVAAIAHFAPPSPIEDFVFFFVRSHAPSSWAIALERLLVSAVQRSDRPLLQSGSVNEAMAMWMADCSADWPGEGSSTTSQRRKGRHKAHRLKRLSIEPPAPPADAASLPSTQHVATGEHELTASTPSALTSAVAGAAASPLPLQRSAGSFNHVWSKVKSREGADKWEQGVAAPGAMAAVAPNGPMEVAGSAAAAVWMYVDSEDRDGGPATVDEMKALFASGSLALNTLVWKSGMAEWVMACTLAEFGPPKRPRAAPTNLSSPYDALIAESAQIVLRLREYASSASDAGQAEDASSWRTYFEHIEGLVHSLQAAEPETEIQQQHADALRAAIDQLALGESAA